MMALNSNGKKVWSQTLDIFGRNTEKSTNFVPFRYQGQYYDEETGLSYNRFRYYDDSTGQYISQDPIGLAGNNPTLYGYVEDTNSWVDILGLMPKWMHTRQGYQRHHIIPQSLKNHPMIKESGINIDGASNMKYLPVAEGIDPNPNKAIHKGWNDAHSDYNKIMNKRLDNLYEQAQNEHWDTARKQKEITELQRKTRAELDSGNLKCH